MNPLGRNEPLLRVMLDATASRQRLIAQNIANADTPNYKAKDLDFGKALDTALMNPDADNVPEAEFTVVGRGGPAKPNGNDVDLEQEVAEAGKNALIHQTALAIVNLKTHEMRSAIAGRSL